MPKISSSSLIIIFCTAFSFFINAQANTQSPSHVYQMASQLENELLAFREAKAITEITPQPAVQKDKKPLHVYSKAIEVRNKLISLQTKHNIKSLKSLPLPNFNATPEDVFSVVKPLTSAMKRLNKANKIKASYAPFVKGKKPSQVYRKLWQVSYLFNGLINPINPNLVYRNAAQAVAELEIIAQRLKVTPPARNIEPIEKIKATPYDVNVEGFKNLYRLANLQRAIKIKPNYVPIFPIEKITPSEVFDTTNNILVEITRIKLALKIKSKLKTIETPTGKKPADVLVQLRLAGLLIDSIIDAQTH
ncbi:MAG: hypothetical protein ISEC1_P1878 [Thiomicrorhabdus sp.]|nr:MAG: hypothetical protein ISEC1_P1878 [Thiomicrorhabdus sp.]